MADFVTEAVEKGTPTTGRTNSNTVTKKGAKKYR